MSEDKPPSKKKITPLSKAFPRGRPGRPKGALTAADTVGVKRAREWAKMRFDDQVPSYLAAQQVADSWDVKPPDIYRDFKRHERRLVEETELETEEIRRALEKIKAQIEDARREPNDIAYFLGVFLDALKDKPPGAD